jgi:CubicO group peptidase (beta-lactamase class C family)
MPESNVRMQTTLLPKLALIIGAIFIAALAGCTGRAGPSDAADPLPTRAPRAPTADALNAAVDYHKSLTGHAMLVMFDGKVIFEQYDNGGSAEQQHNLASGAKCFTGSVATAAVGDGLIKLDDPAAENIPEWKDDPQKSTITYRQLLSMTSGLTHPSDETKKVPFKQQIAWRMRAKPGEQYEYGGYELEVFAYALQNKLHQQPKPETYAQYNKRRILDPIGIKFALRPPAADGRPQVGPSNVTAREWANYGEFIRRQGNWNGEQILDPALLRECFKGSKPNPAYGLTWWLISPMPEELIRTADANVTKNWGAVANSGWLPTDLVAGNGAGTNRLYVIPSLKLVVVRQANDRSGGFDDLKFLGLLLNHSSAASSTASN